MIRENLDQEMKKESKRNAELRIATKCRNVVGIAGGVIFDFESKGAQPRLVG